MTIKSAIAADVLQPHQQRVLDRLKDTNSLLLYHGLGSGKTLSALAAAEGLKMPATVVGPASLKHNFPKEQAKHDIDTPVSYYSYNKPPPKRLQDLLVFDEAHRMGRAGTQRSSYPDIYRAKKTLLLTGTPIRNDPTELVPLMRALGVPVPKDPALFKQQFVQEVPVRPGLWGRIKGVKPGVRYEAKNLKKLKDLLEGHVDYYQNTREGFPGVTEETIPLQMGRGQAAAYEMALKGNPSLAYKIRHGIDPSKTEAKHMNAFMSATRQISNLPGAFNLSAAEEDIPKINRAVEEITKRHAQDPNYRGVTYSNYLEHGVLPIARKLEEAGVPYGVFTGAQSSKEKQKIIEDYNAGIIKHLLISQAGSEGLDLKGTKLMQLLEPHWNNEQLNQVIGRAVRFGSHKHLPENEREVHVQRFQATPRPRGWIFKKQDMGTDEYLSNMARRKDELNQQFLQALQEVGTPKTSAWIEGFSKQSGISYWFREVPEIDADRYVRDNQKLPPPTEGDEEVEGLKGARLTNILPEG